MPFLDPDLALLSVLSDGSFPDAWCVFDGQAWSLDAWLHEASDQPEAPAAWQRMLDAGLDPMVPVAADGTPLLHRLASQGKTALLVALLDRYTSEEQQVLVNRRSREDSSGRTPLWMVCNGGTDEHLVDVLLNAGADPLVQVGGRTMLWTLCDWAGEERIGMLHRLLRTSLRDHLDDRSDSEWGSSTALSLAIAHENAPGIRALIDAGARLDLRVQDRTARDLIADKVAQNGDPAMVALLHAIDVDEERKVLRAVVQDTVDGTTVHGLARPARRL